MRYKITIWVDPNDRLGLEDRYEQYRDFDSSVDAEKHCRDIANNGLHVIDGYSGSIISKYRILRVDYTQR